MTTTSPTNNGLADNFKVAYSPADSFKKSIKRNASLFTTFKEGKYWDTWCRNTLATARAHDVAEVVNPDYLPVTADYVNLFKEKHKFMHAIFDKMSQTDRGKKHAREHKGDHNAQSLCLKMNSFCNESTNARVSSSTTLSYAT